MSIRQHIQDAVNKIQNEKQVEIRATQDRVLREKITPFNDEIDKSLRAAISQLQENLNSTIMAHQETFAKQKQSLMDAAEKKKSDNCNAVISYEVSCVSEKYDKAIKKLETQIAEMGE